MKFIKELQKKEVWMLACVFTFLFFVISSPQIYSVTRKLPGGKQLSTLIGHSIVYLLVSVLILVFFKMYDVKL